MKTFCSLFVIVLALLFTRMTEGRPLEAIVRFGFAFTLLAFVCAIESRRDPK